MGRLVTKEELFKVFDNREFRIDINWYIADAKPYYEEDSYRYNWPSKSYPYSVIIHGKSMQSNSVKIKIRQWVELNLQETVIVDKEIYTEFHTFYLNIVKVH